MDEHLSSYIAGLKYELRGALEKGDKNHEAAVKAELNRVAPAPSKAAVETADAPAGKETR